MDIDTIGKRIRRERLNKELKLKELSSETGLSIQALSQYELDKRIPDIETINKISNVLNVTATSLLYGKAILKKILYDLKKNIFVITFMDDSNIQYILNSKIESVENKSDVYEDRLRTNINVTYKRLLIPNDVNIENKLVNFEIEGNNILHSYIEIFVEAIYFSVLNFYRFHPENINAVNETKIPFNIMESKVKQSIYINVEHANNLYSKIYFFNAVNKRTRVNIYEEIKNEEFKDFFKNPLEIRKKEGKNNIPITSDREL